MRWISYIWADPWTALDGILSNIFPMQIWKCDQTKVYSKAFGRVVHIYYPFICPTNIYLFIAFRLDVYSHIYLTNKFTHSFHKDSELVNYGLDKLFDKMLDINTNDRLFNLKELRVQWDNI